MVRDGHESGQAGVAALRWAFHVMGGVWLHDVSSREPARGRLANTDVPP